MPDRAPSLFLNHFTIKLCKSIFMVTLCDSSLCANFITLQIFLLQQNMLNVWIKYRIFGSSTRNPGDCFSGELRPFWKEWYDKALEETFTSETLAQLILFNDLLPTSDLGILCSDLQSINHTECCNTAIRTLHSESHKSTSNKKQELHAQSSLHGKPSMRKWF